MLSAADWLDGIEREMMKPSTIAMVGMAGRFPGARNVSEFWRNLRDGVESIRSCSDAELLAAGVTPEELASPDYVKRASVLDDVPMFASASVAAPATALTNQKIAGSEINHFSMQN